MQGKAAGHTAAGTGCSGPPSSTARGKKAGRCGVPGWYCTSCPGRVLSGPGWGAIGALQSLAWALGWPVRTVLLLAIGGYRVTVGRLVGGNCRFHPSCSAYAMEAIRSLGAVRGTALAAWRILRCSPLSRGG